MRNSSSVEQYDADKYMEFYLNNIDIDKHGNVYNSYNDLSPYLDLDSTPFSTVYPAKLMPSQGWALPYGELEGFECYHSEFNSLPSASSASSSRNNALKDDYSSLTDETLKNEFISYATSGLYDYKEGNGRQEDSRNWTVNGNEVTLSNGVALYVGTAKKGISTSVNADNVIEYEVTGISFSSFDAAFIEIRLIVSDPNGTVTDFAVEWQSGGTWYSALQSEFASNPYDIPNKKGIYRSFFPLYTHKDYGFATENLVYGANAEDGSKTITGLRVTLICNDDVSNVTVGLDYVRPTADSRHSVNGSKYIIALNDYASFHGDTELLKRNVTRARKAMLFMLEPLQGKNGLINNKYLHRHDSYKGAANGFWDIYPACNLNCEANIYFYEALIALARIEDELCKAGLNVIEPAVIEWNDLCGNKRVATYAYDSDDLRSLAETVKSKINDTFYNSDTGRFAYGVYDVKSLQGNAAGTLMDYGFTELNLHAVASYVADDEKTQSIMKWINGERTVSGDKVLGGDIYTKVFAPVTTTVEHKKWRITATKTGEINSDFTAFYVDKDFGEECQDGGYIMHVSYYDLMARKRYYGADNVRVRLEGIAGWLSSVTAKSAVTNGNYSDFFKGYYGDELQGDGTNGAYGLQDEFKEAAMVYSVAAEAFLGLYADYDVLTVSPDITGMSKFGMTGLQFSEIDYDCFVESGNGEYSISLKGIKGVADKKIKAKFIFKLSDGQNVYVNGKILSSDKYAFGGGYAEYTTDFTDINITVK